MIKNSYFVTRKLKNKSKVKVFGFDYKFTVKGKHLIVSITENKVKENKK